MAGKALYGWHPLGTVPRVHHARDRLLAAAADYVLLCPRSLRHRAGELSHRAEHPVPPSAVGFLARVGVAAPDPRPRRGPESRGMVVREPRGDDGGDAPRDSRRRTTAEHS